MIRTTNLSEIFVEVKPNNKNNISVFKAESSKVLVSTDYRCIEHRHQILKIQNHSV